jgi:hypothetical protein
VFTYSIPQLHIAAGENCHNLGEFFLSKALHFHTFQGNIQQPPEQAAKKDEKQ